MATAIRLGDTGHMRDLDFRSAGFVMDAAYPTGGYPVTPAQFGLKTIRFFDATASQGYIFEYVAGKLKVFVSGTTGAALNEAAANLAALNGVVVTILAVGDPA